MQNSLVSSALLASTLFAQAYVPSGLKSGDSLVPHDKAYYKHFDTKENVEIIYTEDNLPFAKQALEIEAPLHKDYQKFYEWKLDTTLYVGLISEYNQIANGFSTQWPNNRQINYMGGTQKVDYFTTTSWLDTLVYHETAHNYQTNVKDSEVSQFIYSILGNGSFLIPLFPLAVPNVTENSFMLEGNAVLNESWHGNGGRLYSGRFKAETILQAEAGNIVASDVYNAKLAFPYGEIVYIQGGFYNLYMAKKYGLESINSYFKYKSRDWLWPFYTNATMEVAVGKDFETTLNEYADEYKALAKEFVKVEGQRVASSQFFSSLGNSDDTIFFLTNESGVRSPELVVLDKESQKITKSRESFLSGKVLKVDEEYFTQGSRHTSPTRIYQGLFSKNAFIKEGTESKMVQAYLHDGREVYFDVASSYSQPQLYVDGEFYEQVNSSVIVDNDDNLYYFKQEGKTRTLYKNRTPLLAFEGFYGIVSDVDSKGSVYFVANSKLGSTLYCFKNSKITRVSRADNIIEARLLNDDEVLLAAISEKDYYYVINGLVSIEEKPFETKLFFEDKEYYGEYSKKGDFESEELNLDKNYYSFLDMHYSGSDFEIGASQTGGVTGSLNVKFGDTLSQNALNLFLNRDESNVTIAGLGYSNAQYLLKYSISAYGVVDNDERVDTRDSGFIVGATLPLYQAGYYYAALSASYFQDYDTKERAPLSAMLSFGVYEQFGVSMYANYLNVLNLYALREREDVIVGGAYSFKHDLVDEFYLGLAAKYSKTNSDRSLGERGVKLSNISVSVDKDPSSIDMPSLTNTYYIKEASYGEVSLSKVINLSAYFFTFPLSLQREALYAKYRYYDLQDYAQNRYSVNEETLGLTFSTVSFNSLSLPISVEYIHNDASFIEDTEMFRFLIGSSF